MTFVEVDVDCVKLGLTFVEVGVYGVESRTEPLVEGFYHHHYFCDVITGVVGRGCNGCGVDVGQSCCRWSCVGCGGGVRAMVDVRWWPC